MWPIVLHLWPMLRMTGMGRAGRVELVFDCFILTDCLGEQASLLGHSWKYVFQVAHSACVLALLEAACGTQRVPGSGQIGLPRGPDLTNSIRAGRSDILAAALKVPLNCVVAVGCLAHRMPTGPATWYACSPTSRGAVVKWATLHSPHQVFGV